MIPIQQINGPSLSIEEILNDVNSTYADRHAPYNYYNFEDNPIETGFALIEYALERMDYKLSHIRFDNKEMDKTYRDFYGGYWEILQGLNNPFLCKLYDYLKRNDMYRVDQNSAINNKEDESTSIDNILEHVNRRYRKSYAPVESFNIEEKPIEAGLSLILYALDKMDRAFLKVDYDGNIDLHDAIYYGFDTLKHGILALYPLLCKLSDYSK